MIKKFNMFNESTNEFVFDSNVSDIEEKLKYILGTFKLSEENAYFDRDTHQPKSINTTYIDPITGNDVTKMNSKSNLLIGYFVSGIMKYIDPEKSYATNDNWNNNTVEEIFNELLENQNQINSILNEISDLKRIYSDYIIYPEFDIFEKKISFNIWIVKKNNN